MKENGGESKRSILKERREHVSTFYSRLTDDEK